MRNITLLAACLYANICCANSESKPDAPKVDHEAPSSVKNPDDGTKVQILFFRSTPVDSKPDLTKMHCDSVLEALPKDMAGIVGLNSQDLEKMTFGTKLAAAKSGWLAADTKQWVKIEALRSVSYEYTRLVVTQKDIDNGLRTVDLSTAEFSFACEAPSAVTYASSTIAITTPPTLKNWHSAQAKENSVSLANETEPNFQILYGRNKLGYGVYAKGGLIFKLAPFILSTTEPYYDRFSLQWVVNTQENREALQKIVPQSIDMRFFDSRPRGCSEVSIRFSNKPDFKSGSYTMTPIKGLCEDKQLFAEVSRSFSASDETTFDEVLNELPSFSSYSRIMELACDKDDMVSSGSCNQMILKNVERIITDFIAEKADLYVEISFKNFIKKRFRIDTKTGQIQDIGTYF